ncbi:MAG: GlsB/YeaQ/YmgE family stress response membrane protein [Candidatus Levybacteria bacterium]|nr:GlsB/YeaQ/YmgE family stress response membrane protein [Candidatus Levybacteria bacterium]
MDILVWIVFGALAGWIASVVMKTDAQQGALMNVILGVIGAFVGGLIFNFFGAAGVTGFNLYSILVAVVGAAILILAARMIHVA